MCCLGIADVCAYLGGVYCGGATKVRRRWLVRCAKAWILSKTRGLLFEPTAAKEEMLASEQRPACCQGKCWLVSIFDMLTALGLVFSSWIDGQDDDSAPHFCGTQCECGCCRGFADPTASAAHDNAGFRRAEHVVDVEVRCSADCCHDEA